jgi:hypothetical protein
MYDGAICGLILLGTPHFRAGLAQWAVMCARANKNKEKNKGISVTAEEQNWSTYAEDITALTRIQSNFCEGFTGRNVGVKIVCCFADVSELSGRADLVSIIP